MDEVQAKAKQDKLRANLRANLQRRKQQARTWKQQPRGDAASPQKKPSEPSDQT